MADHKDCTLFPSTVFILSVVLHSLYIRRQNKRIFDGQEKKKLYNGSCHCNAVQFQVKAPVHLVAWNCNCSVCFMKKNWHFIVPEKDFTILKGEDQLTTYQFNTKVAKHKFCRICGVQAYYHPR